MTTRRIHLDNLRTLDPVMLDILTQEPVRNPITQLSSRTIADFVAFAELDNLPKTLRTPFDEFARRMPRELSDLPPPTFEEMLVEFEELDGKYAPYTLRIALEQQAEQRGSFRQRLHDLLARWEPIVPEGIELISTKTVVHRVKTNTPDESAPKKRSPSSAPRERGEPAAKATRAAPVKFVDEARQKWIKEQVLERLSEYLESGLREDVLVTGVRHRARNQYSDLSPIEVVGILKDLAAVGRIRTSAGRWKRVIGSW